MVVVSKQEIKNLDIKCVRFINTEKYFLNFQHRYCWIENAHALKEFLHEKVLAKSNVQHSAGINKKNNPSSTKMSLENKCIFIRMA